MARTEGSSMSGTVVGIFSGIGGFERGFELAGFRTVAVAEIDPACSAVLATRNPTVPNLGDITSLTALPSADILVAGFPCQPYSQAGATKGLKGGANMLRHMLRLIDRSKPSVVVLENVAFILHLHGGAAVTRIVNRLARIGYSWAYRLVDTRAFGLPQRRLRWIMIASRDVDATRLFQREASAAADGARITARGFYWTEGTSGIGWADNAIPPLKGGSTIGIPGPPAIWNLIDGTINTPDIRDAERLQGFPAGWTQAKGSSALLRRSRWRLVGNAVSVPMAQWLARGILSPARDSSNPRSPGIPVFPWPKAARGWNSRKYLFDAPRLVESHEPILSFLKYDLKPLSYAATSGFRQRYEDSILRKDPQFIQVLRKHERAMHDATSDG